MTWQSLRLNFASSALLWLIVIHLQYRKKITGVLRMKICSLRKLYYHLKISAKSITKLLLPQHLILRVVSLATLLKTSTSKDRLSSVSYHWWGRGLGNWIVWPELLGIATGNKFNLVSHVQLNIILLYAATIRIKTRSTLNSHFLKSSIHILNKNSSMIFHVKWLRNI